MAKIYTKTGDQGETGLISGVRARKDHRIFWVIGSFDELNASLGLAVAEMSLHLSDPEIEAMITRLEMVQADLFTLGAEVAALPDTSIQGRLLHESRITELENHIDKWWEDVPPLDSFVLPGGTRAGAILHQARTICRRAERNLVGLGRSASIRPEAYKYLNRLSDWLFAAARYVNLRLNWEEKCF
jgi:cob(I)alamin adenosyltransferase